MDAFALSNSTALVAAAAEALAVQIHAACAARRLRVLRAEFGGRLEGARVLLAIGLWEMASSDFLTQAAAARRELDALSAAQSAGADQRWSLRTLAPLAGAPRETLRRELRSLHEQGWLRREGPAYELAPRAHDWIEGPVLDSLAADLCATASLLQVLRRGGAAADAQLAQLRAAALATDPAATLAPPDPPPLGPEARAEFLGFLLRHFAQAAQIQSNDLIVPLLLAEVAQRNFAVLLPPQAASLAELVAGLREGFVERARHHPDARASNGFSLAGCLGLAHETTRRRLSELVRRGFLERDPAGLYWCRGELLERFASYNREREATLLRMAGRLLCRAGSGTP